jgi:hypothetical protein
LDGEVVREDEVGGFISWECEEFIEGGPTLVEVGFFDLSGYPIGFILFDGGDRGSYAYYQRAGLDHRWDWGPNVNDYAFVISPDGTGLYYDFSAVRDGGTTSASEVFECSRK